MMNTEYESWKQAVLSNIKIPFVEKFLSEGLKCQAHGEELILKEWRWPSLDRFSHSLLRSRPFIMNLRGLCGCETTFYLYGQEDGEKR